MLLSNEATSVKFFQQHQQQQHQQHNNQYQQNTNVHKQLKNDSQQQYNFSLNSINLNENRNLNDLVNYWKNFTDENLKVIFAAALLKYELLVLIHNF